MKNTERAWGWVLRVTGLTGFGYIIVEGSNPPAATYILLAGMIGLPDAVTVQKRYRRKQAEEEESD